MMLYKGRFIFNISIILFVVVFSLLSFGCYSLKYKTVKFEGISMLPAIKDGETIYLNSDISELKRGDIVAFYYPKDTSKNYIKRIVGLPNETIEIRGGKVFINGHQMPEPFVDAKLNTMTLSISAIKIPENSYYVMGDNRDNSSDSRSWGFVSRDLIYGVAVINQNVEKQPH